MTKADAKRINFIRLPKVGQEIILVESHLEIAPFIIPVAILGLNACVWCELILGENICDIVILIVVDAVSIRFKSRPACTHG